MNLDPVAGFGAAQFWHPELFEVETVEAQEQVGVSQSATKKKKRKPKKPQPEAIVVEDIADEPYPEPTAQQIIK